MLDDRSALQTFAACFAISSACGIAAKLRKGDAVPTREWAVAGFYSGCVGLVIGLLWYNYWGPANPYFLIGVSGLAGLGGVSVAEIFVQIMSKGGILIQVRSHEVNPPLGEEPDQE